MIRKAEREIEGSREVSQELNEDQSEKVISNIMKTLNMTIQDLHDLNSLVNSNSEIMEIPQFKLVKIVYFFPQFNRECFLL
jgi:hypothetical protein